MFDFPQRARKDRVLPKNKIYDNARLSRAVRERFVAQIDQIIWRYVLGPGNLNLPPTPAVREIQVFEIALKSGELREDVLRTIDRAIPSSLFFELTFQGRVRFVAAYKRASLVGGESGAGTHSTVVETYFETPWQDANAPRQPLPVALDMAGLYEQMLRQHIAVSPFALRSRAGEPLETTVERVAKIRGKRRECKQLESKLRKEVQFNRKVEINAELRQRQAELTELAR
jgi:hypothetical protein